MPPKETEHDCHSSTHSSRATAMPITALVPWFGAKRTLAADIVEELGCHQSYWEPFCGSMAVLLSKPVCRMETVNDLHADLVNLARVIQDRSACCRLYRRLRHVLMHEELVAEAKLECSRPFDGGQIDEPRAYWFFIRSWVGRNGTAGTGERNQHFCRRFTANGGGPAVRLASAIRSIPQWRRRLARVCILRMDGFEMLQRIEDSPTAAIYVDPPYLHKNAKYLHDFAPEDHPRLAGILGRFKLARVVVSYYQHPALSDLYPGWTVR